MGGVENMPTEELKPCPFCGEKENLIIHMGTGWQYFVICKKCNADRFAESKENAIKAWNTRTL